MIRNGWVLGIATVLSAAFFVLPALASDAQMYFSSDKNGQNRVTNIQEGDEVFIVVIDNDQNIDCDVRDKMGPDVKIMDPKTGAYIVWQPDADADWLNEDFLEETGSDTGVFVSNRSFQVGTRESYAAGQPEHHTHVVDRVPLDEFQGGHYQYASNLGYADDRGFWGGSGALTFHAGQLSQPNPAPPPDSLPPFGPNLDWRMPSEILAFAGEDLLVGRFENMDTLVGMYQDPNDATDVALAMMKIIDVEATISWDQETYPDANGSATITVVDPDENLNCNEIEYVPVFIIVNPGSWNPVQTGGPTNFCTLKRTGGVEGDTGTVGCGGQLCPIRWYDIYNSKANHTAPNAAGAANGLFYITYGPAFDTVDVADDPNDPVLFDQTIPVLFYAQETGVSTGVFQLNLNSILTDLYFEQLFVRDVLVAYYLDPNDFDDFKLATAYIEERQHSITSFTDSTRADQELYWIGRDPVYVQAVSYTHLRAHET